MTVMTIIVGVATIMAGVFAAIQTWEWWSKRVKVKKKKTTLLKSQLPTEIYDKPLKIINFTHPLTTKNLRQIQDLVKQPIEEVIEVMAKLDENESFDPQIDKLVDKIGLTSAQWQEGRFIVHLPGFAQAAATVIAELHGRMGHFPTIVRLRAVENTSPREFELAEIINLQNTRDSSRLVR